MSTPAPILEVLLASWNGARYLREQIDSVLTQQSVSLRILARDDGSHDGTQAILAHYAQAHPERFRILPTDVPAGAAQRNFHQLLLASTAPYAAFCDQDDLWLPHKLQQTLTRMQQLEQQHGTATPLLVYTDLRVVDEALQPIAPSLWQQNGLANATHPPFSQLLADNTVTGCTALLNRALIDRMQTLPPAAQMHDHWAALIAASTGTLAGIHEATVLYRQHGNNVVGAATTRSPLQRLQRLFSQQAIHDRTLQYRKDRAQAQALLDLHGNTMTPQARATTEAFINLEEMPRLKRLKTMQRYALWRSGTARKLTAIADILRS